jgi:hypothetical protein
MKFSKKQLQISILSLFILVFTVGNVCAADDALLKMLPGDCTFCVRVNDLSGSLAKTDQYLTGVAPIGAAMLVNMQLAGIVGDPMLTGIEMNGNFAIVGLSDMTAGVLVPVANYAEFVKNNQNCNEIEGGIAVLSAPNSVMGAFAMAEMADGKYALVVPESEKGKLADMKTALTNASSSLAAKLSESQTKEAATAPVWAYVNLAALYNQFSPIVLAEMDKAQQEITTKTSGEMQELTGFAIKLYKELFKEFAGEVDSATIALTPEMANLAIDTSLRAKDGSELAQMLVADPKAAKTYKLQGYLDNDYAVNALMKLDRTSLQKMYDKMFDIVAKINSDPSFAEQIGKFKELTNKYLDAIGDEMAVSFSYTEGKPPFKILETMMVKDSNAMKSLTKDSMKLAGDFYQAIGLPMDIKYQSEVSTYKNATIDKMVINMSSVSDDPNNPLKEAMEQIYGQDMMCLIAHSENKYFEAMGPNCEADIKALIDRDASAAVTGETKAAIDLLQNTPYNEFVCSINVIKLITGFGEMMQGMGPMMEAQGGGPNPADIFGGLNVSSQSSLAIGGKAADGQAGIRTIVPKQHLMEIFGAVMQIQQKVMPQMTPQPAPLEGQQIAPTATPTN